MALTSVGFGQTYLSVNEKAIQSALVNLRTDMTILQAPKQMMLELTGTETLGPRVNNLYSNAYFSWDPTAPNAFAKAEINDYVNNAHTRRIAADGTTIWAYSFPQNAYTSFRYGTYSGTPPTDFRINMFSELMRASEGPAVFLARLLRETYSGYTNDQSKLGNTFDTANYTTWLPGATVSVVTGGASMQDPVAKNRTYQSVPGGLDEFVVYTYAQRPQRSAAFHLTVNSTVGGWNLSEVYYADEKYLNPSTPRLLDWKITVYTGTLPSTTNFVFIPPAKARAIANVRSPG